MKRIKKINEDWSRDYTYDFTDNGFEVAENGNLLAGKYKGQFVHSDISSWFEEMLAKLSDEQKVVRSKTYFNELTGNASFEVEIKPALGEHSIEVEMDDIKHKFYLDTITRFNWNDPTGGFYVAGNLESGQKKELWIGKSLRGRSGATKSVFHLGNRTRGISVSKEDVKKVLDLIDSDDLFLRLYNNLGHQDLKYSELDAINKDRIDQIRLGLLKEN
jgi:hypothetical protein